MCQTFFEIFRFFYGFDRVWGFDFGSFLVNLMSRFATSNCLKSQIVILIDKFSVVFKVANCDFRILLFDVSSEKIATFAA